MTGLVTTFARTWGRFVVTALKRSLVRSDRIHAVFFLRHSASMNRGTTNRRRPTSSNSAASAPSTDSRPEGARTYQPRATPWVAREHGKRSPEGAKEPRIRRHSTTLSRSFRASVGLRLPTPRALPWADMLRPSGADSNEDANGQAKDERATRRPTSSDSAAPAPSVAHQSHHGHRGQYQTGRLGDGHTGTGG